MQQLRRAKIFIPSKTFLAGEYLALKGQGAITFASTPRFQLQLAESSQRQEQPFHENSPAGRLWLENQNFFETYSFSFGLEKSEQLGSATQNFSGAGFGGSTAEFIGLHTVLQLRETLWIEQERIFDLHRMLADYQRLSRNPFARFEPSGADLVGQVRGGITYFGRENGKIQTFAWPFPDLKLMLFSTGHKLKTHEHLETLADFPTGNLLMAVEICHQSLRLVDQEQFVKGLIVAQQALYELGFVAPKTQELINKLQGLGALVAKGCGALGADVVACCYLDENIEQHILALVKDWGGQLVATHKTISDGLSVQLGEQ